MSAQPEPDATRSWSSRSRASRCWLPLVWLLPVLAAGWTVYQAPAWLEPRILTVTLAPGHAVMLGREALWAPQADSEHVLLRREADGAWRLTNIAAGKQVLWRPAHGRDDRTLREWPLTPGATFTVGAQSFAVLTAAAQHVVLQTGTQRWEYDGLRLRRDGQPLPECYPSWRTRLRERLADLGWRGLVERPLRLGGGVYCADRLGLPGVPVDTALIAATPVGFVLRPGSAGRPDGRLVTVAAGAPEVESLWRRAIPLANGDRLIVGRTQYQVARTTPALELTVVARARRWPAGLEPPRASPVVAAQWRTIAWLWPPGVGGLAWPLSLALPPLALGLLWPRRWRGRLAAGAAWWRIALALALAGACLGAYLSSLTVPVLWPYLLAWPALLVWLRAVRSPWSVGLLAALTLLLGGGLVTLLQLGLGAGESDWMRHGGGGAALAGLFGWLAWAGRDFWIARRPAIKWMETALTRWSSWLLGSAALASLALQAGFGDESGWGGLQPFELTKLALVAAAAHALTPRADPVGRGWSFGGLSPWLRGLGPAALLLAASGFALAFLRDFSPLVLLLPWVLTLAWAWSRVHSRPVWRWGGRLAVCVAALALAAGAAWLRERPGDFPLNFQAERIRVWAAPEQYPHSGYQLRRALEAIRVGGWRGAAWSDTANGRVMAVPAVENDFTPTFFLNRYGGWAALVLVGLQTIFTLFLFAIAGRALEKADRGPAASAAFGAFAYFALYGGAALIAAHFLVSWGTNLGFLPVMGQPMPLLSAAGSHLLLFVLPITALAVAVEEKNHGKLP